MAAATVKALQPETTATAAVFIVVVFLWAINWPVMKIAIGHIDPTWLAATRFLITVLFLGALAVASGRMRLPYRDEAALLLAVALLQMAAFTALSANSLRFMPAGPASIIAYATPLWVAAAAALVLGEPIGWRGVLAAALGLCGVAVLASPALTEGGKALVWGVVMLFVASICWSVVIIVARGQRPARDGLVLVTWQAALASLLLLPVAFLVDGAPDFSGELEGFLSVGFTGVFATALPFLGTLWLATRVSALTMSVGMLCVPALAIVLALMMLGEPLTAPTALGLVCILLGVLTSSSTPNRRNTVQARDIPARHAGSAPHFAGNRRSKIPTMRRILKD